MELPSQPCADVAELMLTYDALPTMDYGRVDEFGDPGLSGGIRVVVSGPFTPRI